jgi:hypothetical protein
MKSIAQVAGSTSITIDELRRIERDARSGGALKSLSGRRRELLPTGLMVVRLLAERLGARTLHYTRIDLGEVLIERLRPFCGAGRGTFSRSFLHELDLFRSDDAPVVSNARRADTPGVLA